MEKSNRMLKRNLTSQRAFFTYVAAATLLVMVLGLCLAGPARAGDSPPPGEAAPLSGLDFQRSVDLAMRQSPAFLKSSLEIEVRKVGESDSRFSFIPSLVLGSTYFINTSKGGKDPGLAYTFSTGQYSPLESYFSLQASKVFTKMAILGHIQTISESLRTLARQFLEWDAAIKMEALQAEVVELTAQKTDFLEKRQGLGVASPLEVGIARQEQALAQSARENIAASQDIYRRNIYYLLGLTEDQRPGFDLTACRSQLLDGYDPWQADLKSVEKKSLQLQIQSLKEELQAKNISLAYAKFIPTFTFGVRNPDPLVDSEDRNDMYIALGLTVPIWQGMKRVNDITRQRLILSQAKSDAIQKERDLAAQWEAARTALAGGENSLKLIRSAEELSRLQELQAGILYKANSRPLAEFLDARIKHVQARMETLKKETERDQAVLDIRHFSGDLLESFVKVESIE
ncbi:MAG: TolC family protein [Pseudomonadota bacterium]